MESPLELLHVFPSFGSGGVELRTVALINGLGHHFSHRIIALDGITTAAAAIDSTAKVELIPAPPGKGKFSYPARFKRVVHQLCPDLVLTYNWGSMDAVMGTMLSRVCPVLHAEDGFGADESTTLKRRRVWTRRVLLKLVYATVVPSHTLLRIAEQRYRLPSRKLQLIPNGIDVDRFRPALNSQIRSELGISNSALIFGFVGRFRAEKNLPMLVEAFAQARIAGSVLLLVGSGETRGAIEEAARARGISEQVVFAGNTQDPAPLYAAMNVFVMSSTTEQMPMSLLEAMGCGLPAICTDVGDSAHLLGTREAPAITASRDVQAFAACMKSAAERPEWRADAGRANRERCVEKYSLQRMLTDYRRIYEDAARSRKS